MHTICARIVLVNVHVQIVFEYVLRRVSRIVALGFLKKFGLQCNHSNNQNMIFTTTENDPHEKLQIERKRGDPNQKV